MRVLFYTDRYHPNLQGFVTGLLDAGHDVAMIAYAAWNDESYDPRMHYEHLEIVRPNVHALFGDTTRQRRYVIPNVRALNRTLKTFQPDVVLLKYISAPILFINALCRLKGIRTVLYSPRSPHPTVKHRVRYRLLAHMGLLPHNYFLVAVSGHTNELLPGEVCLPYTIRADARADARTYRSRHPLRILSVGKLAEGRKNNAMMVRALAPELRAGRAELTIIGLKGAGNAVYRQLLQEIADQAVTDRVTLRADLPREACLDAYLEHDLFVLPATRETAGMVILEAMAAGLPVICSNTAGLAFCVETGTTGSTFRDNDAADLHAKVAHFLDKPAEARRMGENALLRVRQRFTPEAFVTRFEALLAAWFGWRGRTAPRAETGPIGDRLGNE